MKPVKLPQEDWEEIYYALETKCFAIKHGDFGPQQSRGENARWIAQLKSIMKALKDSEVV